MLGTEYHIFNKLIRSVAMRATAFVAMAVLLAASGVGAASPAGLSPGPAPRVARVAAATGRALGTTSASAALPARSTPAALAPILVYNRNTGAQGAILLYDEHGAVDRGQARAFMRVAGSSKSEPEDGSEDDERLDLRLVQLAIRAAYHFGGAKMTIVSATRPGSTGKHGSGEAIDFSLDAVKAPLLAAYLRLTPRAGVGIYTHPRTQYVHLDVREHSSHWIDASPPGVTWREQLLSDPKHAVRDASWTASMDLPELVR